MEKFCFIFKEEPSYLCNSEKTMKKLLSSLTLVLAFIIASCQQPAGNTNPVHQTIPVEQFEKLIAEKSNAQILDVRTPAEFNSGHITGAVNLDIYDKGFKEALSKLDKARPVMVYCKSGGRSGEAATMMKEMGFTEVYNMQGGMLAWSNAGMPVDNSGASPKSSGLTQEDYQKQVSANPLVLVDFNATWCMPCKKLAPILDELVKKEAGKLTLLKIDADANPELMQAKQIQGIPYLELYKDGKMIWSNMGMTDEATIAAQLK